MKKKYFPPWLFGIVAGVLFVGAEVVLSVYPPSGYAFCLTCHSRDLINRIVNALFSTNYQVSFISTRIIFLTSPAVFLGAFIAAVRNGERKVLKADKPLRFFLFGFAVMIIGILIFGCPTRLILRSGYGDIYAIAGVAAMFAGIFVGTIVLKQRAVKGIPVRKGRSTPKADRGGSP